MDDEPDRFQARFEGGSLVGPTAERGETDDGRSFEPVEPGEGTGFVVEVKSGAVEVNARLDEVVEGHGRMLEFGSRAHAETYARQLSASDGSLRVQATPENDPRDVDAYLLADHDPSIAEPAEVDGEGWTFDVGANLYGALGEAVLLDTPKPYALSCFVRQDLDLDDERAERLTLDVRTGDVVSFGDTGDDGLKSWIPDCILVAKEGSSGSVLERYYCEIKTGNASFERSQVAVMERLARDERVLKIRVFIEALPDQYSLQIHEVEAEE